MFSGSNLPNFFQITAEFIKVVVRHIILIWLTQSSYWRNNDRRVKPLQPFERGPVLVFWHCTS